MKKILSVIFNAFFKLFKIDNNKIVFEAGRGLIDGNAKAVYDYMKKNHSNQYRLIWLVNNNTDISYVDQNDVYYYRTFKCYYHYATAKYLIKNESLGSFLKKKKNQVYIQLWHGNGALKRIGYDIDNKSADQPLDYVKEWDYYIAKDELDAKHIITGAGYQKKIDILGMPCSDLTISLSENKLYRNKLLTTIGVPKKLQNRKIVLYAPTFRDFDLNKNRIDIPIQNLSKNDNIIVLVRLHPLVRDKIDKKLFKHNNYFNACEYPDASELLAISDVLITDYSSIFYQFAPLNRLIIFYPYDFDLYVKLRGGFYLDYKNDLPGKICYNEEELCKCLLNLNKTFEEIENKLQIFNKKYNYLMDGNSTKRFCDKLVNGYFD